MKIRKFIIGIASFLLAVSAISCGSKVDEGSGEKSVSIYALNDFHGAFEYSEGSTTGLSRIGRYLNDEKTKNPDSTIIISSGDMWQGSVESNLNHGALVTEAMNLIGFDSMTIGNHEFDWGTEYVESNKALMSFPLLSCNIFNKGTETQPDYLKPYTIIEKSGLKIGIIGAAKDGLGSSILRSISDKFDFPDPVPYVKKYSDILYTEEDCDAVILSTHDGNYGAYSSLSSVSPVSNKEYINGLFLAHDHQVYNDSNGDVPYVEGGSSGRNIAKITLSFKDKQVTNSFGQIIETETHCYAVSSDIDNLYDTKYKAAIEEVKNEIIGYAPLILSKKMVSKTASEAIVKYINSHLDVFDKKVSYAAVNVGAARKTLSSGKITYGDLIGALPFDNFIVEVKLTKNQLSGYLSDSSNSMSYTEGEIEPDSDGYYYIGTINYVSEIMETKGYNTSTYTSNVIIRDAIKEQIKTSELTNIVPYTNQPDPEPGTEPDVVETTVEGFLEADYDDIPFFKYHLQGMISGWIGTNTDGTQYGDFYLRSLTSNNTIYIYGCSATASCLSYDVNSYVFKNPKDYLTNESTKFLKIGDVIDMTLIRNDYNGVIEGVGVINAKIDMSVEPIPEPEMVESDVDSFIKEEYYGSSLYRYHVTGIISAWRDGYTDASKYGNFYLKSLTSEASVLIYGCSATKSSLVYIGTQYTFTNPQDFLSNNTTKSLTIGDKVEMIIIRKDYSGTVEGVGLIVAKVD